MKAALTKRQSDIFNFIKNKIINENLPPTIQDICNEFGFASTNAAWQTLNALEKKGHIQRITKGSSRGIKINLQESDYSLHDTKDSNSKSINIIGKGTADNPMSVFLTSRGQINIDTQYFKSDKLLFAAITEDSGMSKDGIFEGDIIIAVHDETVNNGDMVVLIIDSSVYIRRIQLQGETIIFEANSKGFNKMIIEKNSSTYKILGKVIGSIRKIK